MLFYGITDRGIIYVNVCMKTFHPDYAIKLSTKNLNFDAIMTIF